MAVITMLTTLLLLPVSNKLWADVCTQDDTKNLPFCDTTLEIKSRVADYVKRVSLVDKQANMHNGATGVDSLHIPPYQWGSEGLHGPLQPCVCDPDPTVTCRCPTSFPCPSALGTAFNDSLYFNIGKADGREARAINNLRNHQTQNQYGDGIDYWSPTLNMQRDPRWGRNQEVPGEDPMLTGNYASMFVQGLQGNVDGLDEDHYQIMACCKHFIANSLEQWEGNTRYDFDAHVPASDFHNYYLPPFRSCVQEGRSKGVMCSYNAVSVPGLFNNTPSCSNDWLLGTTLRESWRFDGYVTSDCGAINDECLPEPKGHGVYNCTVATAKSIQAGTDVDCGPVYGSQIVNAVNSGLLTEKEVDASFSRLTTMQMELGLFDNNKGEQPYFNLGIQDIDSPEHQQLALEAAHQSIVLLKNQDDALPLKKGGKIAIVGPHFNATQLLISNYHGSRCLDSDPKPGVPGSGKNFDCITSPLEAITKLNGGNVVGSQGCDVASENSNQIAEAVKTASSADTIVLCVGIDQSQEREGLDRTITTLPGVQNDLAKKILDLKKKTIVVVFSGGAMSLGDLNDGASAVVYANYGGEMGGIALADVLFGDYNPSGKLAATWYPADYVNEIPLTEMGLTVGVGRTHMFYTGTPEYAFGSGLSYTDYTVEWGSSESLILSSTAEASIAINVRLSNTGGREGRHTALLFWRPVDAKVGVKQKLLGYQGSGDILRPGESRDLIFELSAESLALVPEGSLDAVVAPGLYELFVTDELGLPKIRKILKVVS